MLIPAGVSTIEFAHPLRPSPWDLWLEKMRGNYWDGVYPVVMRITRKYGYNPLDLVKRFKATAKTAA